MIEFHEQNLTQTFIFLDIFYVNLTLLVRTHLGSKKKTKKKNSNLITTVSNLLLLSLLNQWKYREQYERAKDKFTSILETPEYETHKRSKKISDVRFWARLFLFFSPIKVIIGSREPLPRLLINAVNLMPSPFSPPLDHLQDGVQQNQGQGIHPALRHSVPAAHEEGQRHHQHSESNSAGADEFTFDGGGGGEAGAGGEMFLVWFVAQLKYKEVYEKCKAQINIDPEAHEIRAAKEAYKNITNVSVLNGKDNAVLLVSNVPVPGVTPFSLSCCLQLDYKKKYEATKNKWIWTSDRPDFLNAAKNTLQQSDVRQ